MATLRDGARTDASRVTEIFETDLSDSVLHAHINAASHAVDDIPTDSDAVDSERLTEIETWVAAHFAAAQDRDPTVDEESHESVTKSYSGETGRGLEGTRYGQTAISLDPTGTLASGDDGGGGTYGFNVPNARGN